MHYIFSTLTASQVYTRTAAGGGDLPKTVAEVFIAGGTNVPDKHLVTPLGVMTEVDDEQMAVLAENKIFQLHVKNGFIKIEKKPTAPEKVAADMNTRSPDAPMVDQDFTPDEKPVEKKNNRKA